MNGSELVAMIGKNCVGLATDTRLGNQLQTISTQTQKVFKMQDNIMLGLAGLATDINTFHKIMRYKLKMY
jgi:20S proteasome subunit beta 3